MKLGAREGNSASLRSVLIVARETDARRLLGDQLEQGGYLVVFAADVPQAREILQTLVPGAVFIDLPGARGEAPRLIKHLRAHPRLRMVPRLLAVSRLSTQCKPLDSAAVFVKPIDPTHLLRALPAFFPPAASVMVTPPPRRAEVLERILLELQKDNVASPAAEAIPERAVAVEGHLLAATDSDVLDAPASAPVLPPVSEASAPL